MKRRVKPIDSLVLDSKSEDEHDFDIVGRNVTFLRGNRILDEHNWRFESSKLSAILGPSGCGKSTLLNILLGRLKRNITGFVGVSKYDRLSNRGMKVSFEQQNDHLSNFLTVQESLLFSSRLKRPTENSLQHNENISRALELLNLESTRMTKISHLSGGQKRRLSIALELFGNPSMLILDEPTTGLDSGATQQLVISLLKLLRVSHHSRNRMAIIATIHQPSVRVFSQFDHIHIMSKDGRALYSNTPEKLLKSLEDIHLKCPNFHNPADFICELAAGEYGQESIDKLCNKTKLERRIISGLTRNQLYISWTDSCFWNEIRYLSGLIILNDIRQPFLLFVRLIEPTLIAFNNGIVFGTIGKVSGCVPSIENLFQTEPAILFESQEAQRWDVYQNNANIFFAALNLFYVGMTPTLLFFPHELGIVGKQHTNGWHTVHAYFCSKIIVELFFIKISVLSFQSIWYFITEQPVDLFRFVGISFVFGGFHMFGFLQGTIFSGIFASSALKSVYMGVLSMLPFILISGFVVRTDRIPSWIRPASFFSYYRLGYELMVIILYGNDRCEKVLPLENDYHTQNMTIKAPQWLKLIQYTVPEVLTYNDQELGEWTVEKWFPRKNKHENSWILDELKLSNNGEHTILLLQHGAMFISLIFIWLFVAYTIMRHRMSRPVE